MGGGPANVPHSSATSEISSREASRSCAHERSEVKVSGRYRGPRPPCSPGGAIPAYEDHDVALPHAVPVFDQTVLPQAPARRGVRFLFLALGACRCLGVAPCVCGGLGVGRLWRLRPQELVLRCMRCSNLTTVETAAPAHLGRNACTEYLAIRSAVAYFESVRAPGSSSLLSLKQGTRITGFGSATRICSMTTGAASPPCSS